MSKDIKAVIHGIDREILAPWLNDAEVASGVFMYTSSNVNPMRLVDGSKLNDLEGLATALPQIARDRILYLSQRAEQAEKLLAGIYEKGVNGTIDSVIKDFLDENKTIPSAEPDLYRRK